MKAGEFDAKFDLGSNGRRDAPDPSLAAQIAPNAGTHCLGKHAGVTVSPVSPPASPPYSRNFCADARRHGRACPGQARP